MPRRQGDVERALCIKGFVARQRDHNYFFYYSQAGKKTRIFTKTSHGAREIDDHLLSRMATQCRLSNSDFARLIDCPLTRDAYETILIEGKWIDPPLADSLRQARLHSRGNSTSDKVAWIAGGTSVLSYAAHRNGPH